MQILHDLTYAKSCINFSFILYFTVYQLFHPNPTIRDPLTFSSAYNSLGHGTM